MEPHRTRSPFVAFLYLLLRDYVQPGTIEKIVQEDEEILKKDPDTIWVLTNGHLAAYAEEIEQRLLKSHPSLRSISSHQESHIPGR